MHEQERRLSAMRRRGQARAHFELRLGGQHAGVDKRGACYDFRLAYAMTAAKAPHSARDRRAIRATTRRAAAARGSRRSSIACAKRIPATGASRCRRSAIRRRALVIVGLAPGMHGANASGRPFTGDYAGILLYETLHAYGWANQPVGAARRRRARADRCRITNAVKCLPPQNKPLPVEIANCNSYLAADLATVPRGRRDPGARPHRARSDAARARLEAAATIAFAHGARHRLDMPARDRAVRQLSLQPLQHQHADG